MTVPKLSGPMVAPDTGAPEQAVVLLHGYGSNGADLIGLVPYLRPALPRALFVAPDAPVVCAINPGGFEWFDLSGEIDPDRLAMAAAMRPVVTGFLAALWEQTGLGAADTALIGFSQGTMIALDTGLRLSDPVAGIVGFSGLLPGHERIGAEIRARPPVLLVHGDADPVVPYQGSVLTEAALRAAGVTVSLHTSPGAPHTITGDGIEAAAEFLRAAFGQR